MIIAHNPMVTVARAVTAYIASQQKQTGRRYGPPPRVPGRGGQGQPKGRRALARALKASDRAEALREALNA
jgi:hypothetical protein